MGSHLNVPDSVPPSCLRGKTYDGMHLTKTYGAQKTEHGDPSNIPVPDWDNVRTFLEVARASSFRTAATRLKMTGHAVGHRIGQLERQLDAVLFTRHRDGVRLTEDGRKLLSSAEAMEEASLGILRRRGPIALAFQGEVRVAATEGLGTFWLTPRLLEFVRAHPKILIHLHCSMQRPDELILRARADLAVQIEQPLPRDLIVRKIGRMHVILCASRAYLDTYGAPKKFEEVAERHRLVMQYSDQGRGNEYYNEGISGPAANRFHGDAYRCQHCNVRCCPERGRARLGCQPTILARHPGRSS